MTDWDAWNDFARALSGHLRKAPTESILMVLAPPGVELGIVIRADMIQAVIRSGVPFSPDQTGTLRGLGWEEREGVWFRHAFFDDGVAGRGIALAVVRVLADVMNVDRPDLVFTSLTLPDGRYQSLTERMAPPAAPVTLDTTGLQRDRQYYVDPSTGAAMGLTILDHALGEPYWLDDLDLARRNLAHQYAQTGCLIEANPITVGGVRGMAQITKQPIPSREQWTVFIVGVFLAKTTQTVHITYFVDEMRLGTHGLRETMVLAKLRNYFKPTPHPYDPELQSLLPFLRADDEMWDEQFPSHPLTCVRAWLRDLNRIVTVDPAFAALPDFRGTTRQAEGR